MPGGRGRIEGVIDPRPPRAGCDGPSDAGERNDNGIEPLGWACRRAGSDPGIGPARTDEHGRVIMTDEEWDARRDAAIRALRAIGEITDETDTDAIWDDVFRGLEDALNGRLISLDSEPLGLASQARGKPKADACRRWLPARRQPVRRSSSPRLWTMRSVGSWSASARRPGSADSTAC